MAGFPGLDHNGLVVWITLVAGEGGGGAPTMAPKWAARLLLGPSKRVLSFFFHLAKHIFLFPPVGFEGNLSLLDIFIYFFAGDLSKWRFWFSFKCTNQASTVPSKKDQHKLHLTWDPVVCSGLMLIATPPTWVPKLPLLRLCLFLLVVIF